jgi:D-alanyl-D-alanine carboxypeptidase
VKEITNSLVGGKVLNADYQRQWLDSVQLEDPSKPDGLQYGYGITQLRWGANTLYFHGGEMPGFNSFMGYDPANKMTLVVWTNRTVSLDGKVTAKCPHVKSARSDLLGVTAAALPIAD